MSKYKRLVEWANARYQPKRGDYSPKSTTYRSIVLAAQKKYASKIPTFPNNAAR